MAMFNSRKKEETPSCCCGSAPVNAEPTCACSAGTPAYKAKSCCGDGKCSIQSLKVLGADCKSCHEQYENCRSAVKKLGMNVEVEYITDMEKVMDYGIMSMPGIVVNEKVVSMGKVLKAEEIIKLLQKLGYC